MSDNRRVTDANTKTRFRKSAMTYDELKAHIETAPKTWLPALLCVLVESAYRRGGVFEQGGAAWLATGAEQRAKEKIPDPV